MKNSIVRYRHPLGDTQIWGSGPPENYVMTEAEAKAKADAIYHERDLPSKAVTFSSEEEAIEYVKRNPKMWLVA